MMIKAEEAASCFKNGYTCSQGVFSTFAEDVGLDRKTALKIAGSFGAGMGYHGEACGAVTGALMVIGLKYGKCESGDDAAKAKTYALVKEFIKRFQAQNGSIRCRELLPYDISTEAGLEKARQEGVFLTLCTKYVKNSAEILEEIL